MKKTFALILSVLLIVAALQGCAASGPSGKPSAAASATEAPISSDADVTSEPTEEATPTPAAAPEKTDVAIGEVAQLSGMALQVSKVEKSNGTDIDKPGEGKEYIIIHVNIKNIGNDVLSYNPYYFKVQNGQGQINDASLSLVGKDTALSAGELLAGGLVSGTVVFEEPKDDAALKFIYEDTALFSDKKITVDLGKTAGAVEPLEQDAIRVEGEKLASAGEAAALGSVSVTLKKVTRSAGDKFTKPRSGMEYVAVEVTIKNTGTDTISYNPFDFKMRNGCGQQEGMASVSFLADSALNNGELAGNGTVTGTIVFEEPKGDSALVLVYQPVSLFSTDYLAFQVK